NRVRVRRRAIGHKNARRMEKPIATGLYRPNGLAFHAGTLYIAELAKISKLERIEDNLDEPPEPALVYDDLPKDEANGWKFIAVGPDDKLCVPGGQTCSNS